MTQATHYTRTTGFADDERNNAGGRSTVVTADVDFELDTIAQAVNLTIDNLALLQRDDGVMRDGVVPVAALGADTLKLMTTSTTSVPRGAWLTATIYAVKDLVTQSGNTYMCVVAHTSGVFATDLAAVKWLLFQIGSNPAASSVPFSPTSNIASTNMQAALVEVDTNARARDTSVGVSADSVGAVGNGSADDTSPINVAISAAVVLGGDVLLTAGRNYKVTSSLVIPSNVRIRMNGATITWAGGASPVVTTAATGVTINAGIEGGVIDGSTTCTAVVKLNSAYHCRLKDVTLKSNSATCTALELAVNTSGGTNVDGNRNTVFCMFDNVLQDGVCGRAIKTAGDAAAPTVVTDSTFINFNSRGASIVGIDFASWTDSLNFAGFTRVQLIASSAIGVLWNSSSPTTNVGVYSNNFAHLAVDTFSGAFAGRVGIAMNWTKLNKIDYYFNDPPAEGGAYSFSANCQSYDVTHQVGLTSNLIRRLKLEYFGGKDNPIVLFGGGSEITTETVGLEVGLGRTGNGFAYVDLIGDTTFTNYGLRVIRNGAGSSQLLHQGASQLEIKAQTAGGSVGLTTSTGSKVLCNDTGIGFLAATPVAQSTGWGTPTGNAKVASFPGATATLAQTSAQLAQLIIDLKAFGLLGA